jgi:hypothetical protein
LGSGGREFQVKVPIKIEKKAAALCQHKTGLIDDGYDLGGTSIRPT